MEKSKLKNTDLVVDDKDFRKSQQERLLNATEQIGNGVNEFGNYIKETKKYQKISLWITIGMFGILFLSLIGGVIIVGQDDIKSLFVDSTRMRNIECEYNNTTIELKSFEELKYYKDVFTTSDCKYEV